MGRYENFPVCTRQALDYTDSLLQTGLDESAKDALDAGLPQAAGLRRCAASLQALADAGFRMFGFSNGVADDVSGLLQHAGSISISRAWSVSTPSEPLNPTHGFTSTSSKWPLPLPITVGWYRAMPSTLSVRSRRE